MILEAEVTGKLQRLDQPQTFGLASNLAWPSAECRTVCETFMHYVLCAE